MQAANAIARDLTDHWWVWLVHGIAAIILAALAFTRPGATLEAFALLLGAYFVIDGVISFVHGLGQQPAGQSRWPLLIWGVVAILAGVSIFARPLVASALALTLVVGVWAIVIGIMEIVAGIRLREEIDSEWWLILAGIASIVFGILIWINPLAGALSIAYLIGIWALLVGVCDLILGFRIKGIRDRVAPQAGV
ncbi:MAG TPA: HdeD family acid-resistance protein [Candidatus Limnocylindria bacterium]